MARGVPDLLDVGRCGSTAGRRSAAGAGGSSRPRKYGLNGCIPAIVSRVEVSSGAGISDAEGTRRCPRSSKNERKVSRISSERHRRRQSRWRAVAPLGDRGVADDEVAVHQAGGLARGDAVGRLAELELELGVLAGGRRRHRQASGREW